MYDFLIVGAGLAGCVLARFLTDSGARVLVIDKRDYIGGNTHSEDVDGVSVHMHGPHIFHTNDCEVWYYANKFAAFNGFRNEPIAVYGDETYNLPINMNTFLQMFGARAPEQARRALEADRVPCDNPDNLEDHLLATVGKTIYTKLMRGYTEKQWGRSCRELPISLAKRVPVRYTFDNSYFNDRWQGVPIGGWARFFDVMMQGIPAELQADYLSDAEYLRGKAKHVIYTGAVDELYNCDLGRLEYRSLAFEHKRVEINNYAGVAVTNYTSKDVPFTRVTEHKHFAGGDDREHTIITFETPAAYDGHNIPYYPVCWGGNLELYSKYAQRASKEGYVLCGRLAEYKYYSMSDAIKSALRTAKALLGKVDLWPQGGSRGGLV